MENAKFLESLVSLCPDGIIGVDRQGVITLFNQAAEALTGLAAGEVLGKKYITEVYQSPELARQIKKQLHGPELGGPGRLDGLEVEVRHKDGRLVPIRLSAVLIMEDGQEVGSVGFFHDLTRQRALEEELRRLSITDSLTSLANRRHFHGVLAEEVARSERYGRPLSLVCFDLDNFKPFNDNFGHQEGDNILRMVGDCARTMLRGQDFAFRYGGDEFMLLLVETNLGDGLVAGNRFRQAFNLRWPQALSQPSKGLRPVTLSLGVAQYVDGERAEGLIMRADLAMYEAKRAGGDRVAAAQECISAECVSLGAKGSGKATS
ncbi:MAG: GGDEF domain-containing protein [Desulfarculus sp.]|nr:GGDEF domain-containing protein [Desulfarculus sp.]